MADRPTQTDAGDLLRRKCYFVQETITWPDGELRPAIAVEDRPYYYLTDWRWGTNLEQAHAWAREANEKLGVTIEDADDILFSGFRARKREGIV